MLERSVYEQLNGYLQDNNLLPERQSAYRKSHFTETVLLDVLSDAYAAADRGQVTLLGLLDQSSAFYMVDHAILFSRLQFQYGIRDYMCCSVNLGIFVPINFFDGFILSW